MLCLMAMLILGQVPFSYEGFSLGMTQQQIEKTRKLACQPVRHNATWCSAFPRGKEAGITIWFINGKCVSFSIKYSERLVQRHEGFIQPLLVKLGKPYENAVMTIPFGQYTGQLLKATTWNGEIELVAVTSRRVSAGAGIESNFDVTCLDNRYSALLENTMIQWEDAGLPTPP